MYPYQRTPMGNPYISPISTMGPTRTLGVHPSLSLDYRDPYGETASLKQKTTEPDAEDRAEVINTGWLTLNLHNFHQKLTYAPVVKLDHETPRIGVNTNKMVETTTYSFDIYIYYIYIYPGSPRPNKEWSLG